MALVEKNAALIIEEKDLNGEILAAEIDKLLSDKAKLKEIGDNAKDMAVVDAASRICGIVTGLIKN
jgi:UDP-N-acetylglucosamine--N-acetylmuramyl-(pentapeptide) pyrophosphoryl-undecaprenol N-acetylglucosamine transferase